MYNEVDQEGRQFSSLVIIKKRDEFLLLLRPNNSYIKFPNMWSFPGGGSSKGEMPIQTAIRETYEETGLRITPNDLKLLFMTKDADQKKNVYFFLCESWSGVIDDEKVKSEHVKYKWVKHKDLQNYNMPPNNLNLINKIVSKMTTTKNIKLVIK